MRKDRHGQPGPSVRGVEAKAGYRAPRMCTETDGATTFSRADPRGNSGGAKKTKEDWEFQGR